MFYRKPANGGDIVETSILRGLMVLGVAAAIAAGCGEAPTAAAPAEARLNTGTPLSVTVTCSPSYSTTYDCTAQMSGGSGSGYDFVWNGGTEYYDQGGTSKAYVQCYKYSGSYHGTLTAYGTAYDSQRNSQMGGYSQSC